MHGFHGVSLNQSNATHRDLPEQKLVETSAPLVNGIANNALFHSVSQTLIQVIHIPHCCLVDTLPNLAAYYASPLG